MASVLALVDAELVLARELQRDRLAGDDVHQRSTLDAGEHALVDGHREGALEAREIGRVQLGRELLAREDEAAARAAQGLVGGRRHDVGVRERARVDAGGDETRDVGHVHEQDRPDAVGDARHPLEVPQPRIGARAAHDELGPDLVGLRLHRVVIDALGVLTDAVGVHLVELAAEVERHAVGEMAAVGQVHAEDPVARLEDAEVGGHVGLRPAVGLDVDVLGAREQRSARSWASRSATSTYSQPP